MKILSTPLRGHGMRYSVSVLSLAMMLDWAMSEWSIRAGLVHEGNPMPWAVPAWMPVVKIAALICVLALLYVMRKHWPVTAHHTSIGAALTMTIVVAYNALVIGQAVM